MRFTGDDIDTLYGLTIALEKEVFPSNSTIEFVVKNSLLMAVVERKQCNDFYVFLSPSSGRPMFESQCESCTVEYQADDLQDFFCDDCDQAQIDADEQQVKDAATKEGFHD